MKTGKALDLYVIIKLQLNPNGLIRNKEEMLEKLPSKCEIKNTSVYTVNY